MRFLGVYTRIIIMNNRIQILSFSPFGTIYLLIHDIIHDEMKQTSKVSKLYIISSVDLVFLIHAVQRVYVQCEASERFTRTTRKKMHLAEY